ncbi:MAG: DUF503 domain-containing protein [Candidatus Latescibacterota bacterium]|jgi:uncharacterized protein YlxP (DUF503 family)
MTSIVLVSEVQLFLPESQSLKHKRAVLSSLKERLHNRFNVSVAEVDHNDLWQRSTLALAVVSNAGDHAGQVMDKAVRFIESDGRAQLLDFVVEER